MRGALKFEAKTLPGFQPGDCDFRSQSKCTFKSNIVLVSDPSHFLPSFRLPSSPKGDPTPVPSALSSVREYLHIPLPAPLKPGPLDRYAT